MTFVINFSDIVVTVTGAATAVRNELIARNHDVNRFCPIVPGEIAWDSCDCGQLAQTITSVYASDNFPTPAPDGRVGPCGPTLAVVSVTASLVRCVPGVDANGNPPTPAALLTAASDLESDREALRTAITCYLQNLHTQYRITDYAVSTATSVGPLGACGGVELPYQFGISNTCCR